MFLRSQRLGRRHFEPRIKHLFKKLPFGRINSVLANWRVISIFLSLRLKTRSTCRRFSRWCFQRWCGTMLCRSFLCRHSTKTKAPPRRQSGISQESFGVAATVQLAMRIFRAKLVRQSIKSVCQREGVVHELVSDVNAPEFLDRLRQERIELLVSVSCPQIFRQLIELPPQGVLNIHRAILPQYRGVMPSFWMMANGERQAGVSIYFVNEEIDAGELCGQELFLIDPDETLDRFILRSKRIAAGLLLRTIAALEKGTIERRPLDLAAGSYTAGQMGELCDDSSLPDGASGKNKATAQP